jgi:hypothetical protein
MQRLGWSASGIVHSLQTNTTGSPAAGTPSHTRGLNMNYTAAIKEIRSFMHLTRSLMCYQPHSADEASAHLANIHDNVRHVCLQASRLNLTMELKNDIITNWPMYGAVSCVLAAAQPHGFSSGSHRPSPEDAHCPIHNFQTDVKMR